MSEHVWTEEEELGADIERVQPLRIDRGEDWEEDRSLDTSDVHVEDVDLFELARKEPSWVIREAFEDEDLGAVRSGKEANVSLIRRTSGTRSCLLAYKQFRPRAERAFRREEDYRGGVGFGDDRVDRAVSRRSEFGRSVLEYAWAYREFPLMRRAWESGVRVPYPVEETGDGLLMQYIGDEDQAAPRLVEVKLHGEEAVQAFEMILEDMRKLLDAYLVHGDLSAYNILWWEGRPWIIDFPQASDIAGHEMGRDFLRRDVLNVCKHFRRYGVERDPEEVLDDLMRWAPFAAPSG